MAPRGHIGPRGSRGGHQASTFWGRCMPPEAPKGTVFHRRYTVCRACFAQNLGHSLLVFQVQSKNPWALMGQICAPRRSTWAPYGPEVWPRSHKVWPSSLCVSPSSSYGASRNYGGSSRYGGARARGCAAHVLLCLLALVCVWMNRCKLPSRASPAGAQGAPRAPMGGPWGPMGTHGGP